MLTGSLGVKDWLVRVGKAMNATGNTPATLTYTAEFVVTIDATGTPSVSLIDVGEGTLGGSLTLAASREDTHRLQLTMKQAVPTTTGGRFEKPSRHAVWAASVSLFSEGGGDGWAAWVL